MHTAQAIMPWTTVRAGARRGSFVQLDLGARSALRKIARRELPRRLRKKLAVPSKLGRVGGRALVRDLSSAFAFGRNAPRYAERIWINPLMCGDVVINSGLSRNHSGHVINGDWDLDVAPVSTLIKIRACEQHWRDGVPWGDSGVYDHMLELIDQHGRADGCRTLSDVVERYRRLDVMYQQMRFEGRLRSRTELKQPGFRAMGEVYVHVGRAGKLLFGGGGCHRFAAARVIGLECIPAQLGVVHRTAIHSWPAVAARSNRRPVTCRGQSL